MSSLRVRLLLFVVAAFILVWSGVAILLYQRSLHEMEELFDAEMAQSAQVLLTMTLHEIEEGDGKPVTLEHQSGGHRYVTKIAFQVWNNGKLLFHSDNAPPTRLSSQNGYSDRTIGHKRWRVFVMRSSNGNYTIQVGQLHEVRNELLHEVVRIMTLPVMVALPLLALLFWWGIGRGLKPLQRVANEVAQRSADDMSPLPEGDSPDEVRPLTRALNGLLQQLDSAFDRERRFTADAAHELRTPLASIKTQAQVAQRAVDDGERQQALKQISAGVDRTTHLVEQLLTLARFDPIAAGFEFKPIKLCDMLEGVVADVTPAAYAKGIDIGMTECEHAVLCGNETGLAIMMRNLLDNAIRYTPEGGTVDVAVRHQGEQFVLEVSDSGPGVPAEERARVLDRFYRGAMEGRTPGCGLGLSIVQRIAELHNAALMLAEAEHGRGLKVSVIF